MEDLSSYKGNSHNQKESSRPNSEPRVKRVISRPPVRRKLGLWSRVRLLIVGEDARSVGTGVLSEVVVPAVKDLIFDVITEGSSRSLYGDTRSRRSSNRSYERPGQSYHRPVRREDAPRERAPLDRRDRARHDFSNLVFPNAGEAEGVADELQALVSEYGVATVANFYSAVGLTGDFIDDNFGWTNLRGITVRRVRGGYILELPRTEQLDRN